MVKLKRGFKITPWEASGKADYNQLIKKFGVKKIDDNLLKRIKKHTRKPDR